MRTVKNCSLPREVSRDLTTASRSPARIFVVENDRIVAMSLIGQLKSLGYEVAGQASSGVEAVQAVFELQPDLILMDIELDGDLDGVQAAAAIHEHAELPVVFLTAFSNKDIVERAKATAPFGYVLKPYVEMEVHVAIETALYRHRTEQRLRESEQRYRTTVNSVRDGIIAVDAQSRILLLNPTAERITGWKQADAAGRLLESVFPHKVGRHRISVLKPTSLPPSDEPEHSPGQTRVPMAREERDVVVEYNAAAGAGSHEVMSLVLALRDVTDQSEADATLQQTQKLQSLGLLAGGIAHDFNNLLTPILGYADLLRQRLLGDLIATQMADAIATAAHSAAQLTSQMLSFAGKGRFVIKLMDLSLLVRDMTELLAASVSRKAELDYDLPDELPAIEADPSHVRQVVLNLLVNASESLENRSGRIHVSTRQVHAARADLVSRYVPETPAPGDYVVLRVSDSGCGIPDEMLGSIFDPFFSTKFTGRGLGLAAVLGIVRGHGGTLKLSTAPGHGTTFEVYFRASTSTLDPTNPVTSDDRPVRGTVLVAEDEAAVRSFTRTVLTRAGLQVILARDGREAVDVFRKRFQEVDCVLLDLTMPRLSGIEALAEIRDVVPGVPVILMSGCSPEELAGRFADSSLLGVIRKPFRPGQLVDMIRKALSQTPT